MLETWLRDSRVRLPAWSCLKHGRGTLLPIFFGPIYRPSIVNMQQRMSNETTDVTRNPTSIIGEEGSPMT